MLLKCSSQNSCCFYLKKKLSPDTYRITMLSLPVKVYFRVLERGLSRVAAPREEVQLCLGLGHEEWKNGAWDWQVVWCGIGKNAARAPEQKQLAEPEAGAWLTGEFIFNTSPLVKRSGLRPRRMRLQMESLKPCFLCRVERLSCGDKEKSSDIWREPRLHLLHPHIKRSQSGSFGYLIGRLSRCLSLEVVQVNSPERGPQGRSRACWRDYLIWHGNVCGTSGGAGKHFCENDGGQNASTETW